MLFISNEDGNGVKAGSFSLAVSSGAVFLGSLLLCLILKTCPDRRSVKMPMRAEGLSSLHVLWCFPY